VNLEELPYQIGLTLIEGIGDVHAKSLLAYCGSAKEVFRQKKLQLIKVPGIGGYLAASIAKGAGVLRRAEEEIRFIQKYNIRPLFFTDQGYPERLKYCNDSPIMLYYKGNANLNKEKIIAVVGTRRPSDYAKQITEELIKDLKTSGALIVSGLAYGVDVLAHRTALDVGLETVGVVAHGLDRIYPQLHEKTAKMMIQQGGLLTDFMSGTNPDAVNFPKRNRIVAGICDALVMVESRREGGSLITATIAGSYNKDVFAYPGKAGEALSEGGNGLIKQNRATLIENAADLLYAMQWEEKEQTRERSNQIPLLLKLNTDEKKLMLLFEKKNTLHIDEICHASEMPMSKVSALLLQLEFSNLIKSRPGKLFERT
jgi:DNA processing protein